MATKVQRIMTQPIVRFRARDFRSRVRFDSIPYRVASVRGACAPSFNRDGSIGSIVTSRARAWVRTVGSRVGAIQRVLLFARLGQAKRD